MVLHSSSSSTSSLANSTTRVGTLVVHVRYESWPRLPGETYCKTVDGFLYLISVFFMKSAFVRDSRISGFFNCGVWIQSENTHTKKSSASLSPPRLNRNPCLVLYIQSGDDDTNRERERRNNCHAMIGV